MNSLTLQWPPAADEPDLITVDDGLLIARPAAAVFEFATNASTWPSWQPVTAEVSAPLRPLQVGEQAIESIRVGRRRRRASTWTVLACEAPRLWVIATASERGVARIVYELGDEGPLCRFHRSLGYRSHRWPQKWLDANLTRWRFERESERALANLKRVLEGRPVRGPMRLR